MENGLKNKFWSGLVLAALYLGGARLDAATFTASLDRDTIALGETATLSLAFEGGQPQNVPTAKCSPVCKSLRGNFQNFSIVNGQTKSTVTYTFHGHPEELANSPSRR